MVEYFNLEVKKKKKRLQMENELGLAQMVKTGKEVFF